MAISLVSKIFGGGLQVDRGAVSNIKNVYVPPTHGEGYPYGPPPFFGSWENQPDVIGMGKAAKASKKKAAKTSKGKGILLGKDSPFNSIPLLGTIL